MMNCHLFWIFMIDEKKNIYNQIIFIFKVNIGGHKDIWCRLEINPWSESFFIL